MKAFFQKIVNAISGKVILYSFLASVFYALSLPNPLFPSGWGPLALGALFPLFLLLYKYPLLWVILAATIFAIFFYSLANYWLFIFNPLSLVFVIGIRVVQYIFLFFILRLQAQYLNAFSPMCHALTWVGWEYLLNQGFLGYPFGIIAHSQYLFIPFIQQADLWGIWGISLLTVFPNFYLGFLLKDGLKNFKNNLLQYYPQLIVYLAVFILSLGYGFFRVVKTDDLFKLTICAVQPNSDPWKGGDPAYEKNLNNMINLSLKAEAASLGKLDLVIWPETAVVPALRFHQKMRYDLERYNRVVRPFYQFIEKRAAYYLVGNNERELVSKDPSQGYVVKDYNAALLFAKDQVKGIYRKTRLVPFTEYFPYKDIFPGFATWLSQQDVHFYEPGSEDDKYSLFEIDGHFFSVLICFEDTFPDLARLKTMAGAEFLVNLTNDAWSHSEAAQIQHLAMAVFRAVENRRSLLRATTSGQTALIDPNGRIIAQLKPFCQDYLLAELPLNNEITFAVKSGDWFGLFGLGFGLLTIIFITIKVILNAIKMKTFRSKTN